jgi:hypothetical protein
MLYVRLLALQSRASIIQSRINPGPIQASWTRALITIDITQVE